jgi:hypothetical protein
VPDLLPGVQPEARGHSSEQISGLQSPAGFCLQSLAGNRRSPPNSCRFPVSSRRFDNILNQHLDKTLDIILDNMPEKNF